MGRFKKDGEVFRGGDGTSKETTILIQFLICVTQCFEGGCSFEDGSISEVPRVMFTNFSLFNFIIFYLVFVMKQLSDMTKNLFKMGGSNSRLRRGGVCYRINMSSTLQLVLDRGVRHLFMFFYYKLAQKSTCMQLC